MIRSSSCCAGVTRELLTSLRAAAAAAWLIIMNECRRAQGETELDEEQEAPAGDAGDVYRNEGKGEEAKEQRQSKLVGSIIPNLAIGPRRGRWDHHVVYTLGLG